MSMKNDRDAVQNYRDGHPRFNAIVSALVDGRKRALDPRKLAKVQRVLAKRVDSSAEAYKLVARAKVYTPSTTLAPC